MRMPRLAGFQIVLLRLTRHIPVLGDISLLSLPSCFVLFHCELLLFFLQWLIEKWPGFVSVDHYEVLNTTDCHGVSLGLRNLSRIFESWASSLERQQ